MRKILQWVQKKIESLVFFRFLQYFPDTLDSLRLLMYNFYYKYKGICCRITKSEDCYEYVFGDTASIKSPKDVWYLKEFWERIPHLLAGDLGRYSLKKRDNIIYCGAYLEIFAVYASKHLGNSGKVIAFEPDPSNFQRLLEVIQMNKCKNVIAINKATWSKCGSMNFDYRGAGVSTLFVDKRKSPIVKNVKVAKNVIKVPVTTLDKEITKLGFNKIDFIKMDIEGAEIEILRGAKKILANNKVNLAIATNHIVDGEYTRFKVEKLLKNRL